MVNNTWDELLVAGSGLFDLRVEIEGFPFDAVTSTAMMGVSGTQSSTYTPKERLLGLTRTGIIDHLSTKLTDRRLAPGAITFEIVNINEFWTNALITTPNFYAELAATITKTDTAITVGSGSGVTAGTTMHIGRECIRVTNVVSGVNWTIARGQHNSIPHAVAVATDAGSSMIIPITDVITSFDGRRVNMYAYGPGDDPMGSGSIVWRGKLTSDFTYKDGALTTAAAGIASLLEQQLGSNTGEAKLRGYYLYSRYNQFSLAVHGPPTVTASGSHMGTIVNNYDHIAITGFFETANELVSNLNDHLVYSSSLTTWITESLGPMGARITDNFEMAVQFRTLATVTTESYPYVETRQLPHNTIIDDGVDLIGAPFDPNVASPTNGTAIPGFDFRGKNETPYNVFLLDDSTFEWNVDPWRVGVHPETNRSYEYRSKDRMPEAVTMWNPLSSDNRLYVQDRNLSSINTTEVVVNTEDNTGEDLQLTMVDPDFNFEEGYLFSTVDGLIDSTSLFAGHWLDGNGDPYIRAIKFDDQTEINLGYKVVENGSFVDFIEQICSQSVDDGTFILPNITTNDFDIADIHAVYSASIIHPWIAQRTFSFFQGKKTLNDILEPHLMAAGFVLSRNPANAKLTIRKLQYASQNVIAETAITTTETLIAGGFPGWERSKEHLRNTFNLKTGWDPIEEEHTGTAINVIFAGSVAVYQPAQMELALPSRESAPITRAEINEYLVGPLSILAHPYIHITIDVPFKQSLFDLTLGSIVSITAPNIPNIFTGQLGITKVNGVVLGIEKSYETGVINLHVWVATHSIKGYTPAARPISSSFVINNIHDLYFSTSDSQYSPGTTNDYTSFRVSDIIKLEEYDSWTPASHEGTITTDIGGDPYALRVDFDSALSFDVTSSIMRYPEYSGSAGGTNQILQQGWCYVSIEGTTIQVSKFAL